MSKQIESKPVIFMVAAAVAIIVSTLGLAGTLYYSRSEGEVLKVRLENNVKADKEYRDVAAECMADMKLEQRKMSDNIIRIGERLRVDMRDRRKKDE